jgi:Flp pilus assembly protein TadG
MAIPRLVPLSAAVITRALDCGRARLGRYVRRRASDERGQVLVITAISLTMLIVTAGLVVDVGHAMLVQRQLQAGVDAAALAGVQHLPDKAMAESVAVQYSANPGSKNAVNTVGNAGTAA